MLDGKPRAPRLRTLISARISFNGGRSTMDCTIRNQSETGAKLVLPSTVGVPDRFDLIIISKDMTRKCPVAWRRADEMGVSFED
jgi:hypothetical protein